MSALPALISPLEGSHILVVDDISRNLQVVGTMLRNQGYEVMPATSGVQALELAQMEPPDLILLDLMMPGMDGLEVCRRLKADTGTRAIPIIFLTASNEMEHLVNGFDVGAVDYVTKPFNPPELLARVRTHLELKHARDTIFRYGQELRRLNEEKNEFMGVAAHDLRNPLSAVKGYSELIVEEAQALLQGETPDLKAVLLDLKEFGERIGLTTARMIEMVRNLLDANRIEREEMKLNLVPTELGTLLQSVVETQRSSAAAKQQSIHLTNGATPVVVQGDPTITVQVLENLISNAIKYSPPGREIFVRLTTQPQSGRIEVQDQGPGLSAEDQQKLFGKFARLSAKPTGGEHSTGLGLSIVKKMVEAMNGRVWCESEFGHGATFILELPLVK